MIAPRPHRILLASSLAASSSAASLSSSASSSSSSSLSSSSSSASIGVRGAGISSSSCPQPAAPYAQQRSDDGSFTRCPSGPEITLRQLVECASGPTGFGADGEDFDIFRDLADLTGLWHDLEEAERTTTTTTFLPNDAGFYEIARELGYDGRGGDYDEEAVLHFYLESFSPEDLQDVLLYHITTGRHSYDALKRGSRVETLLGDDDTIDASTEKVKPGVSCGERVRLIDAYWEANEHYDHKYHPIHEKYYDIETNDGVVHVSNVLLLPAMFGQSRTDSHPDTLETAAQR